MTDLETAVNNYNRACEELYEAARQSLLERVTALFPNAAYVTIEAAATENYGHHDIEVFDANDERLFLEDSEDWSMEGDDEDWLMAVTEGLVIRDAGFSGDARIEVQRANESPGGRMIDRVSY